MAGLARLFGVSGATVARWLADARLLPPDPAIDHRRLEKLYLDQALTMAEGPPTSWGSALPVRPVNWLSVTFPSVPTARRPRGPRAKVPHKRLVELYVTKKYYSVTETAILGVSTEYLAKRLYESGLTKRPGTFTPKGPWAPDDQRQRDADLYEGGMTMKAVGAELGVSVGPVRVALHQGGVQVRQGGFSSPTYEGRTAPSSTATRGPRSPGPLRRRRARGLEPGWTV